MKIKLKKQPIHGYGFGRDGLHKSELLNALGAVKKY